MLARGVVDPGCVVICYLSRSGTFPDPKLFMTSKVNGNGQQLYCCSSCLHIVLTSHSIDMCLQEVQIFCGSWACGVRSSLR